MRRQKAYDRFVPAIDDFFTVQNPAGVGISFDANQFAARVAL
jgi:hypothetical protein